MNGWKVGLIAFGFVLFAFMVAGLPFKWGSLVTACAMFTLWTLAAVKFANRFGRSRRIKPPPDAP